MLPTSCSLPGRLSRRGFRQALQPRSAACVRRCRGSTRAQAEDGGRRGRPARARPGRAGRGRAPPPVGCRRARHPHRGDRRAVTRWRRRLRRRCPLSGAQPGTSGDHRPPRAGAARGTHRDGGRWRPGRRRWTSTPGGARQGSARPQRGADRADPGFRWPADVPGLLLPAGGRARRGAGGRLAGLRHHGGPGHAAGADRRRRMARLLGRRPPSALSLDLERTLRSYGDLVVPTFADHCIVDLVEAGGVASCRAGQRPRRWSPRSRPGPGGAGGRYPPDIPSPRS